MEVIRRGFDGLDIAFQGQISPELCLCLEKAKEEAGKSKSYILINWNNVQMHVAESGARGGYAFRCDTGPDGATWFFKSPNPNDPWGIRVSVKSLTLALYGLGGVRAQIYHFLDKIGVNVPAGGESISRVDYAVDFLIQDFALIPENFLMHSHTNRSDHEEVDTRLRNGTSGRVTSVTIGKMPGRQIIVYDKRHEVIQKKKGFWWEIWNDARRRDNRPQLNPNEKEASQVWRVELRAGKKHLKDRWGITTWEDLDNKLGDLFLQAISDVRYVTEVPDTNRARWPNHPLWVSVRSEVSGDLFEMACGIGPGVIKEILRDDLREMLSHQIVGLSASLGSAMGLSEEEASEIPDIVARDLEMFVEEKPKEFARKMERAGSRYVFLEEHK